MQACCGASSIGSPSSSGSLPQEAGLALHPIDDAKNVIRGYRDYVETAPEELATGTVIVQAPPAPFIPEHLQGKPALGIVAMYIGDADEGREVMAPLKELGAPAVDLIQPMPYTAFEALLDPFNPKGLLNYHRGMHLSGLADEAIDTYVEYATEIARISSPTTQIIIFRHGGAVSRVPEDATAAGHRDAAYMAHPPGPCYSPSRRGRRAGTGGDAPDGRIRYRLGRDRGGGPRRPARAPAARRGEPRSGGEGAPGFRRGRREPRAAIQLRGCHRPRPVPGTGGRGAPSQEASRGRGIAEAPRYSPECVEGEFCELRVDGVLRSSAHSWCCEVFYAMAHIHCPDIGVCCLR